MDLILYEKDGCHLCEGLLEKLDAIAAQRGNLTVERRDITSREDWFEDYRYEIPVLFFRDRDRAERPITRPSPKLTVAQLEEWLQKSGADLSLA